MVEEEKNDNEAPKEGEENSPGEESATPKPRKMAIPDEVQARLGEPVTVEGKDPEQVKELLKQLYERWVGCESEKYDVEYSVKLRDMQIHDLEMEVSDMRGKFIIPKLKKVHTFKLMDES